jgi:hypothetical protein
LKNQLSHLVSEPRAAGASTSSLKGDQLPNLIVFLVCFCLLAGALILTPPHSGTPDVRLGNANLPSVCTFKNLTDLPCPGCGLVRSVTAVMHGDLGTSVANHRLGWITAVYIFIQLAYRLVLLAIPAWRARVERRGKQLHRGLIVLAVLFALNWIVTLSNSLGLIS